MKQHLFEQRHAADWQRFDECLSALEKGKAERQASERFANDYRHLCQHLALAEERGYSSHLIDQLQQLATNLIVNAEQAMAESERPRRLRVATGFDAAESRLHLEIADSGPGVPPWRSLTS